ncbi:MAG TPA: hypothetical protein VNX65_01335 [Patescibacteria group bacterium]|jgi:hypothetical protein|nr:hypothetical protein [Patescibacteria group bacterium]
MSKHSPVRSISPFYEARGEFAVSRSEVLNAIEVSAHILGRFSCHLVFESLEGVAIAIPDNPLSEKRVRLGRAPHTLLFTGRDIDGADGAIGVCNRLKMGRRIVESKIMVTAEPGLSLVDPTCSALVGTTVHEISHSFALDHCKDPVCIMHAAATLEGFSSILSGEPFCDSCTEDLELASFSELAHNLRSQDI